MDHVGAEDDVEMARLELLVRAGFFEVELLELHLGKRRQFLPTCGKERGRDIAENVGMQAAPEERQHL